MSLSLPALFLGKKGTEETEDSSKTLPEVMVVDTEKTPEEGWFYLCLISISM